MVSLPQGSYTPPHLGVRFAFENDKLKGLESREKGKERPSSMEEWIAEGEKNSAQSRSRRKNATLKSRMSFLKKGAKFNESRAF